jgi:hypothetical protein
MTHALAALRRNLFILVLVVGSLPTARVAAQTPDSGGMVKYGFKGLTLGVEMGLAVGYIATGPKYTEEEWRKLVLGVGVGALIGMSTGIVLALVDGAKQGTPVGFYVMRDAGYGTLFGAAMGAVIGLLVWVDNGSSKSVLMGAAFGTLVGAGVGFAYGVIEAANAEPDHGIKLNVGYSMHVTVSPIATRGGMGLAASLAGNFG